jgi:hypothetical protein
MVVVPACWSLTRHLVPESTVLATRPIVALETVAGMGVVQTVAATETELAAFSLGTAVAIVLWAYGVYCYVQMVRHRRPGVSAFEFAWPPERLTPLGLEYRRRALRSYAAFAVVALLLMLFGRLLGTAWLQRAA